MKSILVIICSISYESWSKSFNYICSLKNVVSGHYFIHTNNWPNVNQQPRPKDVLYMKPFHYLLTTYLLVVYLMFDLIKINRILRVWLINGYIYVKYIKQAHWGHKFSTHKFFSIYLYKMADKSGILIFLFFPNQLDYSTLGHQCPSLTILDYWKPHLITYR